MQHIKWPIAHKRLFGWCTFLENVKRIRVMCIDISHWKFYVHCVWCSQAVGCSVHLLNENPHVHSRVKLNVCKFVDVSDKRTCTASVAVVSVHNGAHTHFGWKYNMCWKSRRSYVCIFLCAVHIDIYILNVFSSLHFFESTSCLGYILCEFGFYCVRTLVRVMFLIFVRRSTIGCENENSKQVYGIFTQHTDKNWAVVFTKISNRSMFFMHSLLVLCATLNIRCTGIGADHNMPLGHSVVTCAPYLYPFIFNSTLLAHLNECSKENASCFQFDLNA